MPALTSAFCQWLLHETAATPCVIVLHGSSEHLNDTLVSEIAGYLNEYDDRAAGGWLSADDALLTRITADSNLRRLLGLGVPETYQSGEQSRDWPTLLHHLAERGRLVCIAPPGPLDLPHQARAFHAAIGKPETVHGRCHISIDPDMALTGKLPQILADVFLEWNHSHEPQLTRARGA